MRVNSRYPRRPVAFGCLIVEQHQGLGRRSVGPWFIKGSERPLPTDDSSFKSKMSPGTDGTDKVKKAKPICIKVEFGGGLELLFGNERTHPVTLPEDNQNVNVQWLIGWLKENKLKERPELFVENGTV